MGATTKSKPLSRRLRAVSKAALRLAKAASLLLLTLILARSSTVTKRRLPAASMATQWWLPNPTAA
jgi:hypothetical protein